VEALVFVLLVLGNSLCQSAQRVLLGRFLYIVVRIKNLITFKSLLWGIMFCKEVLHCKGTYCTKNWNKIFPERKLRGSSLKAPLTWSEPVIFCGFLPDFFFAV
jgi:hypothetical protein